MRIVSCPAVRCGSDSGVGDARGKRGGVGQVPVTGVGQMRRALQNEGAEFVGHRQFHGVGAGRGVEEHSSLDCLFAAVCGEHRVSA